MKQIRFVNLPRLKDEDDFSLKLHVGDLFLYGTRMISQIETKKPGDEISYYQVYNIKGKNVEYGVVIDTLRNN